MERGERLTFEPNTPVKVTFAFDGGKEFTSQFDGSVQTLYSFTDGKYIYAPADLAVKVNFVEPKAGQSLWITRRVQWIKGRGRPKRMTSWQVSTEEPGVVQRKNQFPDTQANAAEMGIDESDLEQDLRQSNEVRQKAANRNQAKENVSRMPDPPAPEPPVDRKPPQMASEPTAPPPVEPEAPKTPERYIWMPNLVEVCRSYTFKLNVGNYESRDFFCAQKAECRPEDADLVSAKLYEFCKAQVMKAVAAETGRKTA